MTVKPKKKKSKKKKANEKKPKKTESEKPKEVLGYIEDFNFDIKITKASEDSMRISLVSKEGTDQFESEFTLKDLITVYIVNYLSDIHRKNTITRAQHKTINK